MTWRVHRELDETTRTLRRGVVRLYPERARRQRWLAALVAVVGALLVCSAFCSGRALYLILTR